MRPTGRLHIGHYFGALSNWIRMQEEYDCFFFVADWHALTTDYADTSQIAQNRLEIATDWLAAGLEPAKCTMFVQSQVPEHAELHLLLSMVTPLGWLERVPTYKEALENIKDRDLHTYGFLGYPVLQCADIVMYGEPGAPHVVPVGEDQVSHVELSREIVRRLNFFYGFSIDQQLFENKNRPSLRAIWKDLSIRVPVEMTSGGREFTVEERISIEAGIHRRIEEMGLENFFDPTEGFLARMSLSATLRPFFLTCEVLCEPSVMLTQTPRIPGTDGRKMSKSYGNAIELSEDDESIRAKTKVMMTDPARKRREDPGNPDVCPVFSWHKLFSTPETIAWSDQGCRTAGIGCIECKAAMAEGLSKWIAPIRARRQEYEADPARVSEILREGSQRAQKVARKTMRRVREAVFGSAQLSKAKSGAAPKAQAALGD